MAGILSKGIKFSIAKYTGGTLGNYSEVPNLQEIPSLGGSPEKVDVTTLADSAYHYINGIKDFGDLDFKFLYDNSDASSNYRVLKGCESEDKVSIKIELPDALTSSGTGTTFVFDAGVSVSLDDAAVNAALTFTCSCALQSDITVSNPA